MKKLISLFLITLSTISFAETVYHSEPNIFLTDVKVQSLSQGNSSEANGTNSTSFGQNSKATNDNSFVFNGTDSDYFSNGEGTFSINPKDVTEGFYIGDKTFQDYLDDVEGAIPDLSDYSITINDDTQTLDTNPSFTGLATETWVTNQIKLVERDITNLSESENYSINFDDGNVQYFKCGDNEDTTIELTLSPASKELNGKITIYIEQKPSKNFYYDFADDNLVAFTDLEDDEKPWLDSETDSIWKFEFISIPGETTWDCDIFSDNISKTQPEPPAPVWPAETTFMLEGGTEQTYDIVGTLGRQWMIDNRWFDEDESEWLVTITSANIGTNVTDIEYYTFAACSSLMGVTIPNSVTSIGGSAFNSCSSLTSMVIPDSVTSIGNYAFYGCRGLSTVTIPDSVTSIGTNVFGYCSNLVSVTMSGKTTTQVSGMSNYPWSLKSGCVITCTDGTITIP